VGIFCGKLERAGNSEHTVIFWVRSKRGADMPHRVFKDRPTNFFCDEVSEFIRKTGEPEKHPDLYTGSIPKDVTYIILRKITIDGKKRPKGDMAPCPMCSPNRFLEGDLVYVQSLQAAAVIGRCCANHAAQAEREFNIEAKKRHEESYLLEAFRFLASKRATIARARSVAEQTLIMYRLFRRDMPELQGRLRTIKERSNSRLTLYEVIRPDGDVAANDYFGPAGFRGSGVEAASNFREIDFGFLTGTTALIKDYQPVTELNDVDRNISFLAFDGDEEAALNFIAGMTDEERQATVASLRLADTRYEKFAKRIQDCLAFFSPENIERLNSFGTHPLNHQQFSARIKTTNGRGFVEFEDTGKCHIAINPNLLRFDFSWELIPFKGR